MSWFFLGLGIHGHSLHPFCLCHLRLSGSLFYSLIYVLTFCVSELYWDDTYFWQVTAWLHQVSAGITELQLTSPSHRSVVPELSGFFFDFGSRASGLTLSQPYTIMYGRFISGGTSMDWLIDGYLIRIQWRENKRFNFLFKNNPLLVNKCCRVLLCYCTKYTK